METLSYNDLLWGIVCLMISQTFVFIWALMIMTRRIIRWIDALGEMISDHLNIKTTLEDKK